MPPKSKRTKTENPNENEDRLSALPDALLIVIITLLPIKSAVSTSGLSQRWSNLWTQITSITLDCLDFTGSSSTFYSIADSIISQLNAPFIHTFILKLDNSIDLPTSSVVDSWFRKICAKNVQVIEVSVSCSCDKTLYLNPPSCVFQTQSLEELLWFDSHNYEFPDVQVNLPNLKNLALFVPLSHCSTVAKLIKACPLLEKLTLLGNYPMRGYQDDNHEVIVEVSSPNLKGLVLIFWLSKESTKFVINAPNLGYLCFHAGASSRCTFVTTPSVLYMALIKASNKTLVLPLLKSISSTRGLHLDLFGLNVLKVYKVDEKDGNPLIFGNLEYLSLALLRQSVDELHWDATDSVPSSLLTNVKFIGIELSKLTNETHLLNLITCLLSSARVLELLTVSVTTPERNIDELVREVGFIAELLSCPRSSSQCQIEFSGKYFIISVDGGTQYRTADDRIVSRQELGL